MYEKQYQRQEANEVIKKIFTDLLFGNYLKDYRIESGASIQENKDYKSALFNYNIILDYVRDLERNKKLKDVLEGIDEIEEKYYLDDNEEKTLTHEQANEQYKMDIFSLTLKEHYTFCIDGIPVNEDNEDEFEWLENSINRIYNTFLKKLKNQNKR